jgi:hypothetical protein
MTGASPTAPAMTGEAKLEARATGGWREAWPALEDHLSTAVLQAMLAGLEAEDVRLVQGITHLPTLATAPANAVPKCGCLVAYGLWIGEGLQTIGDIDERFSQVNRAVASAYRVFGAWDASQDIAEARRLFLPVVRAAVRRRQGRAVPA